MELVEPACFLGLSQEERRAQIYLAFYTWAEDDTLLDPDCFPGYPHQDSALYAALLVQGGTTTVACFDGLSREGRELAMYEAVYAAAGDDTLTAPDCFLGLPREQRRMAFYAALYVIAGDDTLLSPDCFLGSSIEQQELAIFSAVTAIDTEPVDPIPALSPIMYLRADTLIAEEDDPIDSVADLSGNGNDATQGTFVQMPIYRATDIGGKPALLFDGVDDWLSVPLLYAAQYFAVLKSQTATWDGYWGILEITIDNTSQRWGLFSDGQTYFHSDPFPRGVQKNSVDLVSPFDCAPITSDMILVVETEAEAGDNSPRGIGQMQEVFFGNFMLAELIAFDVVQSHENEVIIKQWWAAKYGITL